MKQDVANYQKVAYWLTIKIYVLLIIPNDSSYPRSNNVLIIRTGIYNAANNQHIMKIIRAALRNNTNYDSMWPTQFKNKIPAFAGMW